MAQERSEPAATRWCFDGAVSFVPVAGNGWRLVGVERDASGTRGSKVNAPRLIVDLVAEGAGSDELAALATHALHDAVLSQPAQHAEPWLLEVAGRRWQLPRVRVFVHRDVGAAALAAIPPRRVPWRKRWFWSTLLAVLRTDAGRRWVRRRYGV
jgi:hypothetical protein